MRTNSVWLLALSDPHGPARVARVHHANAPPRSQFPPSNRRLNPLPTTVVEVADRASTLCHFEDAADVETTGRLKPRKRFPETFQYIVEAGRHRCSNRPGASGPTPRPFAGSTTSSATKSRSDCRLNVPYVEGVVVPGQPTPTPGPYPYAVQPGDTIGSIALKFGKDMIELIEANNLIESDILSVGQEILIPDYSPTVADPPSTSTGDAGIDATVTHVVQEGETLGDIAELYGVDSASIIRFNNIANPNVLRLGQIAADSRRQRAGRSCSARRYPRRTDGREPVADRGPVWRRCGADHQRQRSQQPQRNPRGAGAGDSAIGAFPCGRPQR